MAERTYKNCIFFPPVVKWVRRFGFMSLHNWCSFREGENCYISELSLTHPMHARTGAAPNWWPRWAFSLTRVNGKKRKTPPKTLWVRARARAINSYTLCFLSYELKVGSFYISDNMGQIGSIIAIFHAMTPWGLKTPSFYNILETKFPVLLKSVHTWEVMVLRALTL